VAAAKYRAEGDLCLGIVQVDDGHLAVDYSIGPEGVYAGWEQMTLAADHRQTLRCLVRQGASDDELLVLENVETVSKQGKYGPDIPADQYPIRSDTPVAYWVGLQNGDISVLALFEWDPTAPGGGLLAHRLRSQYEGDTGLSEVVRTSYLLACGEEQITDSFHYTTTGEPHWRNQAASLWWKSRLFVMHNPVPKPETPSSTENFYHRIAISDLGDQVFVGRKPLVGTATETALLYWSVSEGTFTGLYIFRYDNTVRAFAAHEFTAAEWLALLSRSSFVGTDIMSLGSRI
jgi:hypothetical protein